MKLLCVFGTRPEAIKLAPLIRAAQGESGWETTVCITAQHRELLDSMLQLFQIVPRYDFDLMQPNQDLLDLSSRALAKFRWLFDDVHCSAVVVQGDTTTALMAALAAAYRRIPVAHVEAGLRSGNLHNPFPEEINRVLISRVAQWNFTPTEQSRSNLLHEGISSDKIFVTGNTVVDALENIRTVLGTPQKQRYWASWFAERWQISMPQIVAAGRLMVVTSHRRESFGGEMEAIFLAVRHLLQRHPELSCVFPVHPNPHVRAAIRAVFPRPVDRLYLIDPVDYEGFLYLLMHAALALTDSGGVQEEAPSFGVPVVVVRKTTERMELITAGCGTLAGTQTDDIVAHASAWLNKTRVMPTENPFGDGHAAQRIIDVLRAYETSHPKL